ncbi:flagellin [Parvibaculum sp.]|jgi:flagellin-like hook-associated protein FlgL|uniref:flagellin N-terminal helical domain-containing protein n=1 Tax=Parvibaculum sp. TaxID=2024848 RepID=UPI000C56F7F8|nr:flagellin [Parvibaculum sp.]HAC58485.1 flagellar protein [Rhodobiaceae bacterium]MAU60026.1 flagellar protein [Parvibaculum sp.]MBO6668967.1 flagellar protein [Parvibaculum sp.]MBO6692108.1 flagellar protein [Parvibaculum sp.]MBO6715483.1 flagellar protein [Parvibaculum sp.]|tara:strand:+ start:15169 stop:16350 length:1182 start_codon:yes stop_codon:yes gene_type:complete
MADVVLSGAIRSNLLSMQNTTKLLDETQLRLATGLRVRSAIDSPTSYFTAQGLNNRASDLNNLLDSMGQGVKTLEAADQGIKSILKLVESMKAVANQALETKINPTTITGNRSGDPLTGGVEIAGLGALATGNTLTITVGEVTASVDLGTASGEVSTVQDLIDWVAATFTGDEPLEAIINDEGQLEFSAANGRAMSIEADNAGTAVSLSELLGTRTSSTNGVNRDKYETDFNNLRDQIEQLASDASYKGVNLLKGDLLSVFFNNEQTSKLDIEGVDLTPDGLLNIGVIPNDSGDHGFAADADIKTVVDTLNAATGVLRQQASTFGANLGVVQIRQDFTSSLINTLESGASELTVADTNEEGAKMLALQTRQQLGTTALSLANQAEQSVLRLFG